MINKDLFSSINKDCYIINTSRGEIVNENDMVEGLKSGIITGYGTDVGYTAKGGFMSKKRVKKIKKMKRGGLASRK